jgi:hypothetical protein
MEDKLYVAEHQCGSHLKDWIAVKHVVPVLVANATVVYWLGRWPSF